MRLGWRSGFVVGLALPAMVSGSMSGLICGVKPLDWIALLTSTIVLREGAVIAALLPVWRGTRVDPMTVLRGE